MPGLLDSVGNFADDLGLTALEAVGMAIRQVPWDEQPGRHPRPLHSTYVHAEVA
ncbi:hypothetical protein [Nocardia sp. NPDC005366]|uniref:hypothetical protein n=1 Tax=Nocardia sp. NPDC005366 TaxID=3156878 RepID=UPI0033BEAF7C